MSIPYSNRLFGALSWYGVLIVTGIALCLFLLEKECKRAAFPKDTAVDCALVCLPAGIIGARLYYVLMSWPQYAQNPISVLYIWEGGLAIYGAVIGGTLGLFFYCRAKKLSLLSLLDILLPCVLLAQAIGRWGNYFNMEAYGRPIQTEALHFFPVGVQISEDGAWVWHMATFFYESLWNACGFVFLWLIRKRMTRRGAMTAWYLLVYGSGRVIIEALRTDSLYIGSIRASQALSLVLCFAAAVFLLWPGRKSVWPKLLCAVLWWLRYLFLNQTVPLIILQGVCAVLLVCAAPTARAKLWAQPLGCVSVLCILLRVLEWPLGAPFTQALMETVISIGMPLTVLLLGSPWRGEEATCPSES